MSGEVTLQQAIKDMRDAMFAVLPFIGTMEEATAVFDFCRDKVLTDGHAAATLGSNLVVASDIAEDEGSVDPFLGATIARNSQLNPRSVAKKDANVATSKDVFTTPVKPHAQGLPASSGKKRTPQDLAMVGFMVGAASPTSRRRANPFNPGSDDSIKKRARTT